MTAWMLLTAPALSLRSLFHPPSTLRSLRLYCARHLLAISGFEIKRCVLGVPVGRIRPSRQLPPRHLPLLARVLLRAAALHFMPAMPRGKAQPLSELASMCAVPAARALSTGQFQCHLVYVQPRLLRATRRTVREL